MTMLDDDRLASLFARAGSAFEVPVTGADDILARAAGRAATAADGDGDVDRPDEVGLDDGRDPPPKRRAHRLPAGGPPPHPLDCGLRRGPAGAGRSRRRRWCAARHTRSITAAPSHAPLKVPTSLPSTTTTTPGLSSRQGTPQATHAAPSGAAFGVASGSASTTTPQSAPDLPREPWASPPKFSRAVP